MSENGIALVLLLARIKARHGRRRIDARARCEDTQTPSVERSHLHRPLPRVVRAMCIVVVV